MVEVPPIDGTCDTRFGAVRDALAENFRDRGELGGAVAVYLDEKLVVDLWGGWCDRERSRPWQRDTLVNVFSVGKAMATVSLLISAEQGAIDLDAPVARYWPQFGAAGKGGVTVRMVLAHRAGLPALRGLLAEDAMYDWEFMTRALAAEEPWWEPGSAHGYHVNTFGFLVGELVRRVSGESIGAFFRRHVAEPLGAEFYFGVGPESDARIADYYYSEAMLAGEPLRQGPADDERRLWLHRVYLNPSGLSGLGTVNTRAWRAAEMPSTNGHSNARAVARIYSALACGGAVEGCRLVQPETIDAAITEASNGTDLVLQRPSRFGLGFQLTQPGNPLGTSERSFGHFGAGGALGFADPDSRLAFAYTMNQAGPRFRNPCTRALIDATYAALGQT